MNRQLNRIFFLPLSLSYRFRCVSIRICLQRLGLDPQVHEAEAGQGSSGELRGRRPRGGPGLQSR